MSNGGQRLRPWLAGPSLAPPETAGLLSAGFGADPFRLRPRTSMSSRSDAETGGLSALLQEERRFPPPAAFLEGKPHVTDPSIYETADRDHEKYWAGWAEELD